MSDTSPVKAMKAFYRNYMDRFNAGEPPTHGPLFEYPLVLTTETGAHCITSAAACADLYGALHDDLKLSGWERSIIDNMRAFEMGKNGGLIIADYSRLRRDGSLIERGRSAYVLRRRAGSWRITGIIDKLASNIHERQSCSAGLSLMASSGEGDESSL